MLFFLRGLSPLKFMLKDSERPPDPVAPLTLSFPLIMFAFGIIFVFYLILFPAGFSDIHLGIVKRYEINLFSQEK